VYRPLARALVAASPVALGGRLVLDVGSGTGAVAEAAAASGARVVVADRTVSMVAYQGTERWPAVAADALRLPFVDGAFDATLAGFLLNHLAPAPALAELARVVRPGGAVLASTWAAERPDPVKTAIDAVITAWGWVAPAWYQAMKTEVEPKLLRAGADRVVNPQQLGGDRMASFVTQPLVVDFVDVVMHDGTLEFRLEELAVSTASSLSGSTLRSAQLRDRTGALVLAIRRPDGFFVTNPSPEDVIEAGDVLISVGTAEQLAALAEFAARP